MREDYLGQQFGSYRLIRLLGAGGSAHVYIAEHIHLDTQVAIKVLDAQLTQSEIEDFRKEALLIASLEHPHIVRVFDFGVEKHIPYLVMQYAPNGSLRDRHPRGQLLPSDKVVEYIKQVARALQFAHEHKVIHRDVKPENMLIDARGNILLSDFGMAVISQSSQLQAFQDVAGTISYMAPEQWDGKPRIASDQYALAIVAYEWLCGNYPFQGSPTEIAGQHVIKRPPALHAKVLAGIPLVERVLFKALEKDPHKRFESIQAFAEALELAVSTSGSLSSRLFTRRATLLGVCGLTLVGIAGGLAFLTYLQKSHARSNPPSSHHNPATSTAHTTIRGKTVYIYRGHSDRVTTVSWSPKGQSIASTGPDGSVQVWESLTGQVIAKHSGSTQDPLLAWSPDGTRIASTNQTGSVQVWNVANGNDLSAYSSSGAQLSLSWSSDGNYLAAAGDGDIYNDHVQIWEISSGQTVFSSSSWTDFLMCVAWAPGKNMLAIGRDGTPSIEIWDIINAKQLTTYSGEVPVFSVAWSLDSQYIASNSGGTVQVWDCTTGHLITTHQGYSNISAIAWSPDGTRIASVNNLYNVEIWNAVANNLLFVYTGHNTNVNTVSWSPDGRYIASGDDNFEVHIWQAE